MFQSFDSPTRPADGPPRLAALRAALPDHSEIIDQIEASVLAAVRAM